MRHAALSRLTIMAVLSLSLSGYNRSAQAGVTATPPEIKILAAAIGAVKISSSAEAGFDNVDVLDRELDGKLSVVSVGSDRTKTNLLSVFTSLKNLTASPLKIEAQTLYKDANGDWLDGGKANWISLTLKSNEELEYRSASLSEEAQDFLVRIRRPKQL